MHLLEVVAPLAVGADFEGDVSLAVAGVLQGELDGATVDTRRQAVSLVAEPGDAAIELARDGGRALGVAVSLVEEERSTVATVVGEGDSVRFLGADAGKEGKSCSCDEGVREHYRMALS